MHKYPLRKRYRYAIPTIKGDCTLVFDQALAAETNEYLQILELLTSDDTLKQLEGLSEQNKYLISFLKKSYPIKRYQRKRRAILNLVIADLDKYMSDIVKMLHVFWDSMYKNTQMPKVNGKKPKDYPFDNHLEVIAKKTGIPMDQLDSRLTTEQIGWYMDKIVYDNYETFPEGQAENVKISSKMGLNERHQRALDIIRDQKKRFTPKK